MPRPPFRPSARHAARHGASAAVAVAFALGVTPSAGAIGAQSARPTSATAASRSLPTAPAPAEYADRRAALAQLVGDGVLLAFGARTPVHDFSQFFQLPSFRYLTDVTEPDAALLMVVRGGKPRSTLFLTPVEPRSAFYYGQRTGPAESEARYGMPGRPFAELGGVLDSLIATGLPLLHLPDVETTDFAALDTLTRGQEWIKRLGERHPDIRVRNAMPLVLRVRARKSPTELALIRRAIEITNAGHRAAMLTADPEHEYELRAALEYEFTRRGAARPAYGSIVGAGINGTTLHYMKDSDPVKPGDLVLMDAGAEYEGYAADVTRTIPVNGTYSEPQREIYALVLEAQKAAERNSQPGMPYRAATDSSVVVRTRGLAKLGLIESEDALFDPPWRANCEANPAPCRQANFWMIHGITHGIGLAVHDPMQHPFNGGTFAEGDAFTIEPGIYVSQRMLDALPDTPRNRRFIAAVREKVKRYEGTGVRIEDSYIITKGGLERISIVPREMDEIEALMRQRRRFTP
jgi:Xaa-Pro aminopeptidase